MIYQSLRVPLWLQEGIKPNHRGARVDKLIYGGDTETINGKPLSLQFYSEDIACEDIIFCDTRSARNKFLEWCSRRKPDVQHVIYFHNLQFDLIELLWGMHERLKENGSEFSFSAGGFDIRGVYGSPTYCTLRKGSDIRIDICDSFSFYRGSLAQASALYCPELPKLRRPLGLGRVRFTRASTKFVEYAMRDAQVTFHIGKAVEELHREFDITQCVSIAHMASRIFRHSFLTYVIPQPAPEVSYASLDAYHGGKNNITVEPGWYPNVYSVDISSAYPHAMCELPSFSSARLYRHYRGYRGKQARKVRRVPAWGVFCVTGKVLPCPWPTLYTHAFKPLRDRIESTWVQGLELNEALESGELKLESIRGHIYDAEKDKQASSLRAFCTDFYARKQREKDKVRRYGYKLILNSISGKFIQTRKRTLKTFVDCDNLEVSTAAEMVAGGLFQPFIAAAITAHTRARIHKLEHQYKAIHTATDGIFSLEKPGREVTRKDADTLGQLVCDSQGDLMLMRNKCYILYGRESNGAPESSAYPGRYIAKAALHGFQGNVYALEKLATSGNRKYVVNRPNKLGESLKRNLVPNEFREREMTLKVGPLNVPRAKAARRPAPP